MREKKEINWKPRRRKKKEKKKKKKKKKKNWAKRERALPRRHRCPQGLELSLPFSQSTTDRRHQDV